MPSDCYTVGTLIEDGGKVGIISRITEIGDLPLGSPMISWRINYEIYYSDGLVMVVGQKSFQRLVDKHLIKVLCAGHS
jgi:hypothetical protein